MYVYECFSVRHFLDRVLQLYKVTSQQKFDTNRFGKMLTEVWFAACNILYVKLCGATVSVNCRLQCWVICAAFITICHQ